MAEAEKEEKPEKDEKDDAAAQEGEGGEAAEGEAAAEGEGKKSKKKLIIIAAGAVVLLLALGSGAFLLLGKSKGEADKKGSSEAAKVEQPVYFDMPQLLVNLNTGTKQTSFIKATITLELTNKEDTPIVEANMPRLMDSYNTFLREMHATDLTGSAGVYRLREEMLQRANTILAPVQVKDVLFRELLVQ